MSYTVEKRKTNIDRGRVYEEVIADGTTGRAIHIPVVNRRITCTLIAGANTGKFETTTSLPSKVKAGTAIWVDWAEVLDSGTIRDVITAPVTAIRGVSTSGEIIIEVCV